MVLVVEIFGVMSFLILAGVTAAMFVMGGLGALRTASAERCPICHGLSSRSDGDGQPCPRCASLDWRRHYLRRADKGGRTA